MEDLEQQQVVDSVTLNSYDKKQIPRNPIFLDGTYMISRSLSSLRSISSSSSSSSSSLTTSHLLRSVSSVPNIELVRKDSIMMTTTTNNNNENDEDDDDSFHVQSKRSSRRSFRKFFFFFLSSSSTSTSFFTTLMGLAMLTWIGAFVVELGVDDSRQLRSNRIMKNGMVMMMNNNNTDTFIHVDESMDEYLDTTTKNDIPKEDDMTISSILQSLSNISIGYFEANHVLDMFLQVQRDTYSSMMEEDGGNKVDDDTSNNKNDNEKSKMLEEEGKNVTGSHVEIILVEESWQNGNTTTEVISINS